MKILIAEDEDLIGIRLKRICSELIANATILIANDLKNASLIIQDKPIDLLLLDLNLNGKDGFMLLEQAISYSFHTIVVSANTDQAIRAFEYGVTDFIAKPFTKERIAQALQRMKYPDKSAISINALKYLGFKEKHAYEIKPLSEILYIQALGNFGKAFLVSGENKLHSRSLDELEKLLPAELFVRIHRSILCNILMIKRIHTYEGSIYKAELNNGIVLPVGRTRIKSLKKYML